MVGGAGGSQTSIPRDGKHNYLGDSKTKSATSFSSQKRINNFGSQIKIVAEARKSELIEEYDGMLFEEEEDEDLTRQPYDESLMEAMDADPVLKRQVSD
jgi:hypothetical protein